MTQACVRYGRDKYDGNGAPFLLAMDLQHRITSHIIRTVPYGHSSPNSMGIHAAFRIRSDENRRIGSEQVAGSDPAGSAAGSDPGCWRIRSGGFRIRSDTTGSDPTAHLMRSESLSDRIRQPPGSDPDVAGSDPTTLPDPIRRPPDPMCDMRRHILIGFGSDPKSGVKEAA